MSDDANNRLASPTYQVLRGVLADALGVEVQSKPPEESEIDRSTAELSLLNRVLSAAAAAFGESVPADVCGRGYLDGIVSLLIEEAGQIVSSDLDTPINGDMTVNVELRPEIPNEGKTLDPRSFRQPNGETCTLRSDVQVEAIARRPVALVGIDDKAATAYLAAWRVCTAFESFQAIVDESKSAYAARVFMEIVVAAEDLSWLAHIDRHHASDRWREHRQSQSRRSTGLRSPLANPEVARSAVLHFADAVHAPRVSPSAATRKVAAKLKKLGHEVSPDTIRRFMKDNGHWPNTPGAEPGSA